MGWQPASTLQDDIKNEIKEWWLEVRGPLALDARKKLLKGSLALGVAATIMMRTAHRLEDWI